MAKNYTYPRVTLSTTAINRVKATPNVDDTTIYFTPIIADKGPIATLTKVHTLKEFYSIFGEISYSKIGQTGLNIANWLTSGGTLLTYRLKTKKDEEYESKVSNFSDGTPTEPNTDNIFKSKYAGTYYENLLIKVKGYKKNDDFNYLTIVITNSNDIPLETYTRITENNIESQTKFSDLIKPLTSSDFDKLTKLIKDEKNNDKDSLICKFKMAKVESSALSTVSTISLLGDPEEEPKTEPTTFTEALTAFWENPSILSNHLATPIDVIMDAAYPKKIKEYMGKFVGKGTLSSILDDKPMRDDIFLFLDLCENTENETSSLFERKSLTEDSTLLNELTDFRSNNYAVYAQYLIISDNDIDTYVSPTYSLCSLIPYNDIHYGIQWATAGTNRGILSSVSSLSSNPGPDEKQSYFEDRINYIEATSREISFGSQRTYDDSTDEVYTALSFINNSRTLNKIKKELELIARDYLFEYNDSTTLANLNEALNKYITGWISNRTLSKAVVVAEKSDYSNETVIITLNIKFTDTIEVISIDITVE